MTKQEFTDKLKDLLSELPPDELSERIDFYLEITDDKIEDGMSEEEAISTLGSLEEICEQIISEIPLSKIVKKKLRAKRKLGALEIVLLSLGSPIWLSLMIAAFAVVISLYASLWAVIASFWAVFASFAACSPASLAAGITLAVCTNVPAGIALAAASLVLAGLAIFSFFGCVKATKGAVWLCRAIVMCIKKTFVVRRDA